MPLLVAAVPSVQRRSSKKTPPSVLSGPSRVFRDGRMKPGVVTARCENGEVNFYMSQATWGYIGTITSVADAWIGFRAQARATLTGEGDSLKATIYQARGVTSAPPATPETPLPEAINRLVAQMVTLSMERGDCTGEQLAGFTAQYVKAKARLTAMEADMLHMQGMLEIAGAQLREFGDL